MTSSTPQPTTLAKMINDKYTLKVIDTSPEQQHRSQFSHNQWLRHLRRLFTRRWKHWTMEYFSVRRMMVNKALAQMESNRSTKKKKMMRRTTEEAVMQRSIKCWSLHSKGNTRVKDRKEGKNFPKNQKPSMIINTTRQNEGMKRSSRLFSSKYLWGYCCMYIFVSMTRQQR